MFDSYNNFPLSVKNIISFDLKYKSASASLADAAFQAWNKGYISEYRKEKDFLDDHLPLEDEYRFVRKYFRPIWIYYILFLRLCTFHHPLKEIAAFFNCRKIKRMELYKNVVEPINYNDFNSELVFSNPLVSIIIPTLNRYKYLKDVLIDLSKQEYKNFEIIIIDQSDDYQPSFYQGFGMNIKLIRQEEKALWQARNVAVRKAIGDYVLLFDDDSRVERDWIVQHLKCLDYFGADISSGVSLTTVGAPIPESYHHFRWADQLDTGNVLIKRNVFKKIGLFDRQFERQRMGDAEFGLRCYLGGFKNISNPKAKRIHLKIGSGGLRDMGGMDAYRPKSIFAPRPVPSILYFYRKYFGEKAAIYALMKNIPPSIVPYRYKSNKALLILGTLFAFFFLPFLALQILYSWRLSTVKLRKGDLIDVL